MRGIAKPREVEHGHVATYLSVIHLGAYSGSSISLFSLVIDQHDCNLPMMMLLATCVLRAIGAMTIQNPNRPALEVNHAGCVVQTVYATMVRIAIAFVGYT